MGLPMILSALHIFSKVRGPTRERDPEKVQPPPTPRDRDDRTPGVDAEVDEDEEDDSIGGVDPLVADEQGHRLHRVGSATTGTFFSSSVKREDSDNTLLTNTPWYSRFKSYILPSDENEAALEKYAPNYRWTPIISGVLVPFSMLLEIPGLTEHWYIRTEGNSIVESRHNPAILDVGLAISIACGLFANVCLVLRFLEKRVKTVTLCTVVFLTIHGMLCVHTSM